MHEDTVTLIPIPRLSKKEALILQMLINTGEMYGLDMIKASRGALKRGTLYTILCRMLDDGHVESRREEQPDSVSGVRRLLYTHTPQGTRAYATHSHLNPARDAWRWWRTQQTLVEVAWGERVRIVDLGPDSPQRTDWP